MAKNDELLPHIIEIKEKLARMEWIPDKVNDVDKSSARANARLDKHENRVMGYVSGAAMGGTGAGLGLGWILKAFGLTVVGN